MESRKWKYGKTRSGVKIRAWKNKRSLETCSCKFGNTRSGIEPRLRRTAALECSRSGIPSLVLGRAVLVLCLIGWRQAGRDRRYGGYTKTMGVRASLNLDPERPPFHNIQ